MLETMLALKNNDMRKIPGYDPEPVEKLRKLQRALVNGAAAQRLGAPGAPGAHPEHREGVGAASQVLSGQ